MISLSTATNTRRRRWLLAGAGLATVVALIGVGAFTVLTRLSGDLAGREGMERSLDQALARGERADERIVIELTGEELADLIADGLQTAGLSVDELTVDIAPADRPDRGRLSVTGQLDEDGGFEGRAVVELVDGGLQVDMESFELHDSKLPRVAQSTAGDLIADAVSVESYLQRRGVRLRNAAFADDLVRIVAVERHKPSDDDTPAASSGEEGGRDDGAEGHPSAIRPGEASEPMVAGEPTVLVVGDSVAAGVGVDDFTESYASRLHAWLQRRDGQAYGLADLARPGETSWSLRAEGQLDEALDVLDRTEAAAIVVDIGANDVLSTLGHPACDDGVVATRCRALVDDRLEAYRASYDATLADLRQAAPRAPLVVLTTYNPFSFGADTEHEQRSDEVVEALNVITARVGRRYGARIADGATPLRGRAADLTHMASGGPPDVHPTSAGYEALTGALVEALERPAVPSRPGGHGMAHQPR